MILSGYGLLQENAEPSRRDIIEHMDDNLCRCGAHIRIIRAIEEASRVMKKGEAS
jgi:aerobic-type carbon monoxide dehydrogenase small subunit (CoxS/CutS family)